MPKDCLTLCVREEAKSSLLWTVWLYVNIPSLLLNTMMLFFLRRTVSHIMILSKSVLDIMLICKLVII